MATDSVRLTVQVQPNAKRSEVLGFENGVLRMKVSAPPVEGKANKGVIELLSKALGIKKSNIEIQKGATSKRKVVMIEDMTLADISTRLGNL